MHMDEKNILNIAAYHFVKMDEISLPDLRVDLQTRCTEDWALRGTILLATEGINLFLAGEPEQIENFWSYLILQPPFRSMSRKDSYSRYVPFNRMLVKLKNEIIPIRNPAIAPELETVPRINPQELKQWLEEEKDFLLLDTRNDFEVELGTFKKAEHLNIAHFCDFDQALDTLPEESRQKPIVTFCTGGIRCEKAGPLMKQKGFEEVYQLDGGILRYFEELGDEHYDGECFVFDQRVAVDGQLEETKTTQCYGCRHVLTKAEQEHEQYQEGRHCPYCYHRNAVAVES